MVKKKTSVATSKHQHSEAFKLMHYECNECHKTELIWNSRDGVTPFGLPCIHPKCEGIMHHVHWDKDEYKPKHAPKTGDYVFITMPDTFNEILSRKQVAAVDYYTIKAMGKNPMQLFKETLAHNLEMQHPMLIRMP